MSTRALVIIDLQNDYFHGGRWTLDGIDEATDNAVKLIDAAREAADLVVHVRHEFPSEDAPFFTPGSEGAKINKRVRPAEGEHVVLKHHVNAFRDTGLRELLERSGIKALTIAGAMSHMCIDAATRAASDYGYEVTLIHDACASRGVEFGGTLVPAIQVHAAYMHALGFAYAKLASTPEYLAQQAQRQSSARVQP